MQAIANSNKTTKVVTGQSLDFVEPFPDMLPDTSSMFKKWVWREDTNSLEQISTGLQQHKDKNIIFNKFKTTVNNAGPLHTKKVSLKPVSKQPSLFSPKPSVKLNLPVNRKVTLQDVKLVALESIMEAVAISDVFKSSLKAQHFDHLLQGLLLYFEQFFEKHTLDDKPQTMSAEPSVSEKQHYETIVKKQEVAAKYLSQKYCTLVLGLDSQHVHHLECGVQRKSCTKRDRQFYETLYLLCCYVIWITFRRCHFELIKNEVGRLFRSSAFNAHGREDDFQEFRLASDFTNEDVIDIRLSTTNSRRNKRPPIKAIINQRSPVLITILPTPKEASARLLDRRKPSNVHDSHYEEPKVEELLQDGELKAGIIGELMSGFNPFTLAPFGDDDDDEEEDDDADDEEKSNDGAGSSLLSSVNKKRLSLSTGHSRKEQL